MQWAQAAEIRPGKVKVQRREGQLKGNDKTHQETGNAPEHGCHSGEAHRPVIVVCTTIDLERLVAGIAKRGPVDDGIEAQPAGKGHDHHVKGVGRMVGQTGDGQEDNSEDGAKASSQSLVPSHRENAVRLP